MSAALAETPDRSGWAGHPRGLSTLFFIEMWERFSYYGMRAFLLYYMVAPVAQGGLGFSDADGGSLYGTYTASVWFAAIFGGLVADWVLGQFRSVLVGGALIALGHLTLAFRSMPFFYSGLALVVLGTGLLKPNVSIIVGSLYPEGDPRRDAGFSIFYMGINMGAVLGPIVAGWLAQRVSWHAGFAAAGVGMAVGLVQYWLGKERLQPGLERLAARPRAASTPSGPPPAAVSPAEWRRMAAVVVFFLFATLFWGAYEQAGSTLALFADRYTRLLVLGFTVPSSWFQSVQGIFVILLAPVFAWLWMRLGSREPSSPTKFALGLLFAGISYLILMPAASLAQSGGGFKVSPWWLIGSYFVQELGELCLSPVGLSVVTKLSPPRLVGMMMGVWFLSNSFGNKLAGSAAGFFGTMPLATLFGIVAGIALAAALLLFMLVPWVRRLMGDVR
jgi:proton-dependent oligopeptide transporter, POT family